ncbi:RNA polymerase II-associated [Coniella lustricola]|uniref:RNA polymerase II-associated n=1 Tax=Coniella lustricola TaxID=2025994 RepID=A0A2T3AFG2_9PEZI|nr:RNA polymerase II-associated [Coniella lustricola]
MSSQASRNGERGYHQDFIARIRYSNALPPPPNPPKLLDIPNTGLASGQYTTPGFASRLAREQPLNIEADAELGMPIDLVGMPGVFDGDESSIQAPSQPPPVHPHDRILLRPLATLGKPQVSGTSVSFLRRTEYISNANTNRASPLLRQPSRNNAPRPPKRKSPEPEAGSPAAIKRKIEQGFDVALENLKDKSRIRHPSKLSVGRNKGLRVVEAFQVLPDLEAFPDSGTYVTYKFAHAPVASSKDYDKRLLSSILRYIGKSDEEDAAYQERLGAHLEDPENNPKPLNQNHYELYLPESLDVSEKFRGNFDLRSTEREDENSSSGKVSYPFRWARSFLATVESEGSHETKYSEEIAFALDPKTKKAWYYPTMQRNRMEPPRRIYNADRHQEKPADGIELTPEDPNDEFKSRMDRFQQMPQWNPDKEQQDEEEDKRNDGEEEDEVVEVVSVQADDSSPRRERSESPVGRGRESSEERRIDSEVEHDADGDEDE